MERLTICDEARAGAILGGHLLWPAAAGEVRDPALEEPGEEHRAERREVGMRDDALGDGLGLEPIGEDAEP